MTPGTFLGSRSLAVWPGLFLSFRPDTPSGWTPRIHGVWLLEELLPPTVYNPVIRGRFKWTPGPNATSRRAPMLRPIGDFDNVPVYYARGRPGRPVPFPPMDLEPLPASWIPPVDTSAPPVPTGDVLGVVPSRSRPSVFYEVRRASDGTLSCNCPGWTYARPGKPRGCRHTSAFELMLAPSARTRPQAAQSRPAVYPPAVDAPPPTRITPSVIASPPAPQGAPLTSPRRISFVDED